MRPGVAAVETWPVPHRVPATSVKVVQRPRDPYPNEDGNDQPQDNRLMFEPERVEQDPRDGRQHDDLQPALQIRHCTLGYRLTPTGGVVLRPPRAPRRMEAARVAGPGPC